MRLLTLPVTLVRVPIEFGFGAAKEAVKLAHGLVGGGGEETVVEEPRPAPKPRRRRPTRRSGNGRARTTAREASTTSSAAPTTAADAPAEAVDEPAAPSPAAEPAPPAAAEPAHVSEEPVLVAEAAETGAEDGAGAEVAVEEPWPGYDEMSASDIEDRLVTEGAEAAAAVSLYEATRKGRAQVLEAATRSVSG